MPSFTLDGQEIEFQHGDTIIQAAHRVGVDIPHYCWHPGLSVAANCRMCLVEIGPPPGRAAMMLDVLRYDEQKGTYVPSKKPKLQPACQMPVAEGMEVKSQTSEHVREARDAVQEMLLLNHPVDCPICDQAGECRLQDYWLEHSGKKKRMKDEIIHMPKAVDFGPTIVYDAERCIVCTRCVRFCEEVVGDPVLDKRERGNLGEIILAPGRKLDHAYTLMTEHVCPVGALTAKDFRFKARVWFLRSARTVCQGCATGCNAFLDFDPRNQTAYRHRPRENLAVNRYWMCDEGVLDYRRVHQGRVLDASVHGDKTNLAEALAAAADILNGDSKEMAVLLSAEHSSEDNFAVWNLAQSLGIMRGYVSGRPSGEGDDILRDSDKNSNRAGAHAVAPDVTLGDTDAFEAALTSGEVKTVLALGSHVETQGAASALSGAVKVVALTVHAGPIQQAATVLLPASSWAEAAGTYVNAKGRVQTTEKALRPLGSSQPAWMLALSLAQALGKNLSFRKAKEVNAAVRSRMAAPQEAFGA
jgi:NADH-quinone oxidoreductase subunit G